MMKWIWSTVLALVLTGMTGAVLAQSTEAGQAAGTSWLALMDANNFDGAYDQAATVFRQNGSKDAWSRSATQLRSQFGASTSRTLQSAKYSHSLPGAPDGDYVVLTYASAFANKAQAIETVVTMKDTDGKWHVVGYFIK